MMFTTETTFSGFVNLDHRTDRLKHMHKELINSGLLERLNILRVRGMLPSEYKGDERKVAVMRRRTPGAIGCHYSQVKIMERALLNGRHAFVMEDDLVFCEDFMKRLEYMERFLSAHPWDIMWLGGTFHIGPPYWHNGKNHDLKSSLQKDAELTDDPHILRTYGAFSTYAYIVNRDSLQKILTALDNIVHESIGIDWAFIKLQPSLFTYAMVPGSVKQMDNQSDIGKGWTIFSGFKKLGPYWYQERMEHFDPSTYNWKEAAI